MQAKKSQRKIEWKFNQKCALCWHKVSLSLLTQMFNIIATMILFNEGTQQNSSLHRRAILQQISITFRLTFFLLEGFNKRNLA